MAHENDFMNNFKKHKDEIIEGQRLYKDQIQKLE